MSTTTLERKTRETVRGACGVRIYTGIWSTTVHAFRIWQSDTVLLTWCGQAVEVGKDGQTTGETIGCLQCAGGSWQALRGGPA